MVEKPNSMLHGKRAPRAAHAMGFATCDGRARAGVSVCTWIVDASP